MHFRRSQRPHHISHRLVNAFQAAISSTRRFGDGTQRFFIETADDRLSALIQQRSRLAIGLRHLYAMAEIARLKRKADVEVYVVSIPDDWAAPVGGTFAKETMNNLVDLGEKMGADPSSWAQGRHGDQAVYAGGNALVQ